MEWWDEEVSLKAEQMRNISMFSCLCVCSHPSLLLTSWDRCWPFLILVQGRVKTHFLSTVLNNQKKIFFKITTAITYICNQNVNSMNEWKLKMFSIQKLTFFQVFQQSVWIHVTWVFRWVGGKKHAMNWTRPRPPEQDTFRLISIFSNLTCILLFAVQG